MTNRVRESRIKEIFNEALELEPRAREAFLNRAAGDEASIRVEVGALIDAHERATAFLAEPAGDSDVARPEEEPGEVIGRYVLVRLIGEGGFGRVWLADQIEPVRRHVALKIIKLGMDTRQVIARFEAERQVLAMMDHANIATVFDAGATASGRPYFVMELVEGVPITEYCDANRLSIEERLDLFLDVCAAVQHAHTKGIIHRDIKPSNVLVSVHEGRPQPKVIDFGIAKATAANRADATVLTEVQQVLGTPEYMSPEQADPDATDIDTRTDVYSLGALLYALLTGATPFDGQRLRSAAFGELQRIMREEEPPKPSTRLSMIEELPDVADRRAAEPRRLTSRLRGDLDWITLKALEKSRDRRYGSAAELADDVRRHLRDEPVNAGPPSAAYRTKKFVRRHRPAVTGVTAVFVALVAGVVATSLALVRAADAADKSQTIASFIQQMLSGIDPQVARGKDTALLRQVLEETGSRISTDLAGQPEVEATIRTTIGQAYLALGENARAAPHLEAALEIRRRLLGNQHRDTLASIGFMGLLLNREGRLDEAETFGREALDGRRRTLGNDHPDTLWSVNHMGNLLSDRGRFAEAEQYGREALDGRRRVLGNDHKETLYSINNFGAMMWDQGRLAEAEEYYREATEGFRRVLGEDHPATLAAVSNMGRLLRGRGSLAEAESWLRDAVERSRRVLGDDHPDTLASINSLAAVLGEQGKHAEAEVFYREALDGRRRVLGDDHISTLESLNNLGHVLKSQTRLDEAASYYVEALEGNARVLGDDHPNTLRSLHNMGSLSRAQGKLADAERYYHAAVEGRRRVLGQHLDTAVSLNSLADLLLIVEPADVHDAQRALELALEANTINGFAKPDDLATLALAYHQTGDASKAIETQTKALEALPADAPNRAEYEARLEEYQGAASE